MHAFNVALVIAASAAAPVLAAPFTYVLVFSAVMAPLIFRMLM